MRSFWSAKTTRRAIAYCALGGLGVSALAAACTSFTGDPANPTADGAAAQQPDASDTPDAANVVVDAGPRCNPTTPFGPPVAVGGLPDGIDGIWLTPSEDEAYYVVGRRVALAKRTGANAFGDAVPVQVTFGPGQASDSGVGRPSLSEDRKTLFYESGFAVWSAVGEPSGPYATSNKVGQNIGQPHVDAVHGKLYVARYDLGSATLLHRSIERAPLGAGVVGQFEPVLLGDASTHNPVPGTDGHSLFFARVFEAQKGDDVYFVAPIDAGLGGAGVVGELSSANTDGPEWLSRDGCHLYLSSNRLTGYGPQIFLAVRGR